MYFSEMWHFLVSASEDDSASGEVVHVWVMGYFSQKGYASLVTLCGIVSMGYRAMG